MNRDDMNRDDTASGDDFWGSTPDWTDAPRRPRRTRSAGRGDVTGAIKGLWNAAMSGGVEGTREHGVLDARAPRPTEADPRFDITMFDDLDTEIPLGTGEFAATTPIDPFLGIAADDTVYPHDATTEVPVIDVEADRFAEMTPTPMLERDDTRVGARRGIDPLLARVGAVAIVTTLLVPLAIGMTSGDDSDTVTSATTEALPALVDAAAPTQAVDDASNTSQPLDPDSLPPAVPVNPPADAADDASSTADTSSVGTDSGDDSVVAASDASSSPESASDATTAAAATSTETTPGVETPASADDGAQRINNCAIDYEVVPGDFWLRLAEAAGVPLAELLEANGATTNTALYPGSTICLPAGASTPAPPTTPTTVAPTTTAAPTTTSTTTTTTTVAPSPAGPEDIKQIIRDVWPDELEERALEIAYRESRYVPTAKNYCCYGIFQIYWSVHRSWLDDIGITDDQQLYDPATNARAAYALYQRAGGWGPWAL